MPINTDLTSNPSINESCPSRGTSITSPKVSAIVPVESQRISTPEIGIRKINPLENLMSISNQPGQGFVRKGSKASTVAPNDTDPKDLSRGDSIKSSSRPRTSSASSENGTREKSILKKSKYAGKTGRKDSHGNSIRKGGKKHRISIKEELKQVNIVENWKLYNKHEYVNQTCVCNVF